MQSLISLSLMMLLVCVSLSRVRLFVTPLTVAQQALLSIEFSRQEYWNGLSFPSQGDLPDPGIKLRSPTVPADSLPSEPPGKLQMLPSLLIYYPAKAKRSQ